MTLKEEIQERITQLNIWTKAYDEGHPMISDKEWDEAYFQLVKLEEQSGIYLPDSPTQSINFQVVSQLEKATHNHPMLSLDKTKDMAEVEAFVGNQDYITMCKMDGLTCSLRYMNGKLISAETRGNGIIGENILHNALIIPSIPKKIPYQEELIVDGEIICTYEDFKSFSDEYKNPRNFAAGSIRLLDPKECAKRNLTFVAWDVIKGFDNIDGLNDCFKELLEMNFKVVPFTILHDGIQDDINIIKLFAETNYYPIDGIVFKFRSRSYGKQLGKTEHHFKNAIAYKFYDETYETRVKRIEWTMGRTGVLTPVAVFDPIDIDGSTVERASLHNLSVLKELGLRYQDQKVEVFKANQIIPQIAKVYDYEEEIASIDGMEIPKVCPICGGKTEIVHTDTSIVLKCSNPTCDGKLINRLDHYCGKKGMDIKGLSKATLEKLIDWGWVSNILDLYSLSDFKQEWISKPGFGEKSVNNILNAIETSKECELWQFISAIGIPLIGSTYAKEIAKHKCDYSTIREDIKNHFDFTEWDGFGFEMCNALWHFNYTEADTLGIQGCLNIKNSLWNDGTINSTTTMSLEGLNIAITGKLLKYKNRDALKAEIESRGGKVVSSVSSKTNYLINNDSKSSSAKNKAAVIAGIPILTEEEFGRKFFDI